jgi:hypothetical protein
MNLDRGQANVALVRKQREIKIKLHIFFTSTPHGDLRSGIYVLYACDGTHIAIE